MRRALLALLLALPVAGLMAGAAVSGRYAGLRGGVFKSVLRYEDAKNGVRIQPFALMRTPVTNAQFLEFVKRHPQWQKGKVPGIPITLEKQENANAALMRLRDGKVTGRTILVAS